MDLSGKQIIDWQVAMTKKQEREVAGVTRVARYQWKTPAPGWLKLNVHDSVFSEAMSFTVGMVLRDDQGEFVCGKNMRLNGQVNYCHGSRGYGCPESSKMDWKASCYCGE